ncbi:ABC transporter permease [Clostridium saccharobutylicum]|uniref:ABC-2 family transporter protein n=1 Tax=Clostridium saccharobutylicum TaxID=169679 RepID=A0A1S8NIT0_CLOSA|nr:ABC transporter permease [Clostridium saccharobutylicum]OOM16395.1 ABC-2 family transporter protein [Clostridium saccharobutylicum]
MFNIIYSEFIKLKKSYILIIALISAILMPGIQIINDIENDYTTIPLNDRGRFFQRDVVDIDRISILMIYIIIFCLISAYVFSREYTDKTANILYTYPISKERIFVGKFITIYMIIIFVYLIQIITTYLGLYVVWGKLPPIQFIIKDIKINIYSMLLQFLLLPIPVLIANLTKNIIFPIIYGLLATIIVGLLLGSGAKIYSQFCPLTLPALPFYYYHNGDPIDFVITIGSAIITFVLFMFLCIYQYRKADIE